MPALQISKNGKAKIDSVTQKAELVTSICDTEITEIISDLVVEYRFPTDHDVLTAVSLDDNCNCLFNTGGLLMHSHLRTRQGFFLGGPVNCNFVGGSCTGSNSLAGFGVLPESTEYADCGTRDCASPHDVDNCCQSPPIGGYDPCPSTHTSSWLIGILNAGDGPGIDWCRLGTTRDLQISMQIQPDFTPGKCDTSMPGGPFTGWQWEFTVFDKVSLGAGPFVGNTFALSKTLQPGVDYAGSSTGDNYWRALNEPMSVTLTLQFF